MSDTRERILDAAETLLRRHGPAKTNVVDMARLLGMSHANVYRHFPSKAALADAVVERWMARITTPLAAIATGPGDASARLRSWVTALAQAKRRKVTDDPEMFATYHQLAVASREVVDAHVTELCRQLAAIIASGVAAGEFRVDDARVAARAVLEGTMVFHHPHFVQQAPFDAARLGRAMDLLLAGLRAGVV